MVFLTNSADNSLAIERSLSNNISIKVSKIDSFRHTVHRYTNVAIVSFRISEQLYNQGKNIKNKSEILRDLIYKFLNDKLDLSEIKAETYRTKIQTIHINKDVMQILRKKAASQNFTVSEIMDIFYQIMVREYASQVRMQELWQTAV